MKNLFLTFALIVASAAAFSQITVKPGVRAGVNFATITNTDLNYKTDFYFGVFTEIKFAAFYALQPEINYTRQGGKDKLSSDFDVEIQYVSFGAANKFSPFKDRGLHFIAGPAINIKTGDNNNIYDNYESYDIVLFGGIGYEFPFGLSIEGRYNLGLIDVFGYDLYYDVSIDNVLLNNVFQLGATYKFNL